MRYNIIESGELGKDKGGITMQFFPENEEDEMLLKRYSENPKALIIQLGKGD